jgi:hypothetical protein
MLKVTLVNVHTDAELEYGPYEFVQLTYSALRVGPDGAETLVQHLDGWWTDDVGRQWSDVIVAPTA